MLHASAASNPERLNTGETHLRVVANPGEDFKTVHELVKLDGGSNQDVVNNLNKR